MRKPNFLIVGAAKSGTTSLYGYLKQHPEIFLSEEKECRFFSNANNYNKNPFTTESHSKIISEFDDYIDIFKNRQEKIIGEASPDYLYYYKKSIENILKVLGKEVKILIILRNPVDRAFSNYCHIVKEGFKELSFEEILKKEEEWKNKGVWYGFLCQSPGFYYHQVRAYLENFKSVKVIIFDDYVKNVAGNLQDVCAFLGIEKNHKFQEPAFKNLTGLPKNKFLHQLLTKPNPYKDKIKKIVFKVTPEQIIQKHVSNIVQGNLKKPKINKETEKNLKKAYVSDISELEKLLGISLTSWK